MTQLDLAAPLAAALATKGYASLTPVQESVLAPEAEGRDLLVSAQTGSGKTVAFGLAVAPEILAGADRLSPAEAPVALVIAPTRELALQVARELGWLYGEAGAQVATCVGGMDIRNERRALERGPHIVVGTPGRLRDHIERGSLDLAGLRAAVLDEADEMLDLGFREDLEFILGAAPADRRTLMFSATVPRAIEELAKTLQRDALRLQTAGEARQHVDIEYRALSVAVRDREPAIFNLLRLHDAQTAIVFCKTRANVNHLLARMGNRGFQVVALSGELSQAERTHALQALRDGRARVCIATDVAARGIDLPGLELVIHADLPTNSETLLHRSGRTGRAGAKGVSALIVTPAEFKKAQRLLQGARVVAEWGSAPSADEVKARDDARILEHPALAAEPEDEAALAALLLDRHGAERVAAAFVRLWREGRSAPEELSDAAAPGRPAPRERAAFGDSVWFSLAVGRSGRAEARWLLPKVCEAGGITKAAIGAIRVQEDETFVQIAAASASRFPEGVEVVSGVAMRRLEGEPVLERAERPAPWKGRPAHGSRPPRDAEPRAIDAQRPEATPATAAPAAEPSVERQEPRSTPARERTDSPRAGRSREDAADTAADKPRWKTGKRPPEKAAPRTPGVRARDTQDRSAVRPAKAPATSRGPKPGPARPGGKRVLKPKAPRR
ncbi:DEAD/DEAH box helicase [Rubellimicrobium roseum]|uniref:DEAD/DEAH box helicase n=1 Tax=Rubellimicrobium roseum TaxID=687525 RepID=A0A5C4NFD8_9RHOB|nr:DEAD/DEAH box helicase [Rubellimicrobium roseum]TNC71337.1 DEAD/DEAH box helicase [Rubellimicrobium roseum]